MFVKCFETGYTGLQRLKSYFFLFIVQWYGPGPFCFTTTEARLLIRDGEGGGEPRTATSTFTQVLSSGDFAGPFCFTSTEARWLIRDGDKG